MEHKAKYTTKDLGCSAFIHANKCLLDDCIRDGKLINFVFTDHDEAKKYSMQYYNGGQVSGIEYWHSLKILKTLIHEGKG